MDKGHAGSSVSRLDADVRPSASELAGALIGMPDAIVVCDEAGDVVLANERVTSLLGYTPAALIGRPLGTPRADLSGGRVEPLLPRGAGSLSRPSEGREMLARRHDGSDVWVEITA